MFRRICHVQADLQSACIEYQDLKSESTQIRNCYYPVTNGYSKGSAETPVSIAGIYIVRDAEGRHTHKIAVRK